MGDGDERTGPATTSVSFVSGVLNRNVITKNKANTESGHYAPGEKPGQRSGSFPFPHDETLRSTRDFLWVSLDDQNLPRGGVLNGTNERRCGGVDRKDGVKDGREESTGQGVRPSVGVRDFPPPSSKLTCSRLVLSNFELKPLPRRPAITILSASSSSS